VYTVWGACEDVQVLEKLRSGEYNVHNLHIIDEAHSRLLDIGGVRLRLLGLGGAVVMHKLFDNGEGRTTIAGGQGTMWTTLLQMGELVDTANRVYDPTETRVFVTHASPAREGLLNQLSVTLKADFSISAGLHFRYGSSYNEFSVNPTLDHYRGKLAASKASFNDVWETVKAEVEPAVSESESQQRLLQYAIDIVNKMPSIANGGNPFGGQTGGPASGQVDESAFKNMWNFNLADAAYGWLVLDIDNGRIGTEMRAQGFNFSHRSGKNAGLNQTPAAPIASSATAAPPTTGGNQPPAQVSVQPPQNRTPVPSVPVAQTQARGTPTPVSQAQQQGQQNKPATAGPTGKGSSPAPNAPKDQIKPATPQPPATATAAVSADEKAIPSEVKPNGTAAAGAEKAEGSPAPKSEPRKPSKGLFIQNVADTEEAKNLLAEEDKTKLEKIEKSGRFVIAHFATPEDMQAALGRIAADYKNPSNAKTNKPYVQPYKDRSEFPPRYGAGTWGSSTRGGQPGGYRSGGASDSEGGQRGRGFRGRGGRGGERGGRGRGRGQLGGAGESAASPAPSGDA
jgi:hypothetical protein